VPRVAGQHYEYIVKQLKDFRARQHQRRGQHDCLCPRADRRTDRRSGTVHYESLLKPAAAVPAATAKTQTSPERDSYYATRLAPRRFCFALLGPWSVREDEATYARYRGCLRGCWLPCSPQCSSRAVYRSISIQP
jgi:hypothetical protein